MSYIAYIRTMDDILVYKDLIDTTEFKIFGFILYHSFNKRIQTFFHLGGDWIDRISGKNTLLFLVEKSLPESQTIIEQILNGKRSPGVIRSNHNPLTKAKDLVFSDFLTHIPYSKDESFQIAESLGIRRSSIPCVILFRKFENILVGEKIKSFALLELKDNWFPQSDFFEVRSKNGATEEITNVLTNLFDCIDELVEQSNVENMSDERFVEELKRKVGRVKRKYSIYKPMHEQIANHLKPLLGLPFSLIKNLNQIVVKIGTKFTEDKVNKIIDK